MAVIGSFPDIHPDELFYSACARFSARMSYPNKKFVLQELFGSSTIIATIDFPCHLRSFISSLPPGHHYTVDGIIDQYTLLPFFSYFLPQERVTLLRDGMRGAGGLTIHKRSGIMASRIPTPLYLRFCPLCIDEDRKEFGEAFWHRIHQLPGVFVCPTHHTFLEDSSARHDSARDSLQFVTIEDAARAMPARKVVVSNPDHQALLKISCDALWLLRNPITGTNLDVLRERYNRLLIDRGLATYTGSLHITKLLSEFRQYYSPVLLQLLHCEFTGSDQAKTNWLLRLVRPPKHAQHPLYHLLLIQFLGRTAEEFLLSPHEPNIFGAGPWPCLNPAAEHYRELVIQEYKLSSRLRDNRPVATFSCKCGFTYARSGLDSSAEDSFRIGRIIAFGPVWEAKLRLLWEDSSNSLSEIGRRLRVDPLTVRRHATKLKLPFNGYGRTSKPLHRTAGRRAENNSAEWQKKRHACRSEWLSAARRTPKASFKELRCRLPREYAWLRQNDSAWLKSRCPKLKRHVNVTSGVDWRARDAQYAVAVKSSASRLRSAPGRPIQVTRTAIGRDLGAVTLLRQKHHNMPLTTQVLATVTETQEEYAVRRVWWAADLYLDEKMVPQEWQLILRASVYRSRETIRVRDAIQCAMRMLTSELSVAIAAPA